MLRLFLSLYLAVAFAFAAFFIGINFIPEHFFDAFMVDRAEQIAAGPHYLLERELISQPVADWPAHVERLQQHFGYALKLVHRDDADLKPDQVQRSLAGRVVTKDIDGAEVWFLSLGRSDWLLSVGVDESDAEHVERMTGGFFHLFLKAILERDEPEWPDVIADLQPHFSFPLRLVAMSRLDLPTADLQRLERGDILGYDVDDHQERYYKRIADSSQALMVGPIAAPWLARVINYLVFGCLAAVLAFAVLLWLWPVWRDMVALDRSTTAFGSGDFNTRLQVSRRSPLRRLARTFNDMAGRIQRSIDAHKELVDAVSHELRTPIARMRFGMDMLANTEDASDRGRYIESMEADIDELDTLVNELLTYARLDRPEVAWHIAQVELGPWLNDIVASLQAETHNVSLVNHAAPESAELRAKIEPHLMPRAIGNLIRNALRYAHREVYVSLVVEPPDIVICVDDDGPGIPPASRQVVFEPFRRLDTSRNRDSGGYGLGLAIVQRITASHQGHVYVEDSPLGGARFCLRWPGLKAPSTDRW